MSTTKVSTAMMASDMATQAELDAVSAASTAIGVRTTALENGTTRPVGATVQVVNTQTGAVATGTTILPNDDTIPQNTEGFEVMTLSITPTSASNKLKIEVTVFAANNAASAYWMTAALFQDSTANALACGSMIAANQNHVVPLTFTHYMTAGTTGATTFKVRIGASVAGTTTLNGQAGARFFGGVMASTITITEIKA